MAITTQTPMGRLRAQIIPLLFLILCTTDVVRAQYKWHRATIGASSDVKNAESTITLTLSPNVDIPKGTVLTVTGLLNSLTETTASLQVTGLNFAKFELGADWDQRTGTLKLTVAVLLPSLCDVVASVTLSNPGKLSQGVTPSVSAKDLIDEASMSGVVLKGSQDPGWATQPTVTESSNVRNMPNILTFNIIPNAPLQAGSTITLASIDGTQKQSRCGPANKVCIGGGSASIFGAVADWSDPATLILTVAEKQSVNAYDVLVLTMEVMNPAEARKTCTSGPSNTCSFSPVSITINGAIIVAAGRNPIPVSLSAVAGNVLSAGTEYAFTKALVWENNTFSNANSVLYFSLQANVLLPSGAQVVVAGLAGSGEKCTQIECNKTIEGASKGIFERMTGTFAPTSGVLTLTTVRKVEAGSLLEFEMSINNRLGSQTPVAPTVQVRSRRRRWCTHTCAHACACARVHVRARARARVRISFSMFVCFRVCVCACVFVCVYIYI
jgi:hypothetical protein